MLTVINYHYIRENFEAPYPSIFGVTPEQFAAQLDVIGASASFLGIGDLVDIMEREGALPGKSVMITFDDGLKEQYVHAWPILKEKAIPAAFFVNTAPLEENSVTVTHKIHIMRAYTRPQELSSTLARTAERHGVSFDLPPEGKAKAVYRYDTGEAARLKYFLNYVLDEKQQKLVVDGCFCALGFDEGQTSRSLYMTKEMTAGLGEAGVLGTHGHAHRPLGLIGEEEALEDLDTSLEKLAKWTGREVIALSYPFGFYEACSRAVSARAAQRGVKLGFTLERAVNRDLAAPMFLGRFSPNDVFNADSSGMKEGFWETAARARWFR